MLQTVLLSNLLLSSAFGAINTRQTKQLWQPEVGSKFQIILSQSTIDVDGVALSPEGADVWDIDLVDNSKEVIQALHKRGKKVICYFSAGTTESWRPDYSAFLPADLGAGLPDWPREKWLDIRSTNVWEIMKKRIKLASDKGCDGIDPDNMDGYGNQNGGGFANKLTQKDTVDYMKKLAAEARSYGISIGLKNAEGILRSVQNDIQYAVNEECNIGGDCGSYSLLLNRGKPVFHIEYAKYTKDQNGTIVLSAEDGKLFGKTSDQIKATLCLETTLGARKRFTDEERAQYSTVIKTMNLDGWVMYCDGTWGVTKTKGYGSRHGDRGGGQDDKTTGHTKPTFGLGKNPRVGQPTASDPPQNQVESGRGWKGFLSGKNSGRKPASPAHPPPQRQSPADDVGQTSGGESHQDQGKSGYGWIGVKGWKNIGQKPGIAREAPPKSHQSPSNVVDPSPDDGSSRSLGGNIFGWKGFQGGKNASWKPTYPVRPLPQRQPPADDVDSSPEESTRQSGEDEVSKKNDQRSYGGQKGYGQWGNMGSGRRGASNGREDVENENDEDTGRENQQTRGRNDENGAGSQRGADGDRI